MPPIAFILLMTAWPFNPSGPAKPVASRARSAFSTFPVHEWSNQTPLTSTGPDVGDEGGGDGALAGVKKEMVPEYGLVCDGSNASARQKYWVEPERTASTA